MAIITKGKKQEPQRTAAEKAAELRAAQKRSLQQAPQTTTAVATRKATDVGAPTDWEAQLARYAQRSAKIAESLGGSGNWITFRAGVMSYKGLPLKDNEVELVALVDVRENLFYEGRFDPDTPATPVCFAFGNTDGSEVGMAPHETSPQPQHETCKGCPQNAFGSSDTGKGKACKNIVRMSVIAWGDGSREQLDACELAFVKLPVTSTKNWGAYIKAIGAKLGVGPQQVVTRMYVEPDEKNQFSVRFDLVEQIDRKLLPTVMKRAAEAEREIVPAKPYEPFERDERPASPPRRGKPQGRQPARAAKY